MHEDAPTPKEPYEKPAFRFEDVLDGLASTCADCDVGSGAKASSTSFCPADGATLCTANFSS